MLLFSEFHILDLNTLWIKFWVLLIEKVKNFLSKQTFDVLIALAHYAITQWKEKDSTVLLKHCNTWWSITQWLTALCNVQ